MTEPREWIRFRLPVPLVQAITKECAEQGLSQDRFLEGIIAAHFDTERQRITALVARLGALEEEVRRINMRYHADKAAKKE